MPKLYLASPFFNPQQLAVLETIEKAIDEMPNLTYYSPRVDGVLKDMTPEERKAAGPRLFRLNCKMVRECDAVLALKDYSDTGTTWETGFAYGIGRPVFGFRSNPSQPLNIMVLQSFAAAIYGYTELGVFLRTYAKGGDLEPWALANIEDTY